jgi:ABC-type sugar transport system permease subunit
VLILGGIYMGKRKNSNLKKGRNIFLLCVLVPTFIWFLIFFIIPFISVVIYSFTNAHMAYPTFKFVGFDQYRKAFQDATFLISFKNTIVAALIIVPATIVLSILLAAGLNALSDRTRQAFTFIYFLPSVISAVAISLVWDWLYSKSYGLFNAILNALGFESQAFLTSTKQALICLCIIQIWEIFGYYAVILLAALRGIDSTMYEAADIDGANQWQKFRNITIPMLSPYIFFNLIMGTIGVLQTFDNVYVMTGGTGGPVDATIVPVLLLFNKAFRYFSMGYASALAWIMFAIILVFTLFQLKMAPRWVHYEAEKSK